MNADNMRLIDCVYDDGLMYDWQAVGYFRNTEDGKLYWAEDGGCSCYSAFDSIPTLDFELLTLETLPNMLLACEGWDSKEVAAIEADVRHLLV